jgi:ParB-like nuclease domain
MTKRQEAQSKVQISLDKIDDSGRTQVRVRLDENAVEDYAEMMRNGAVFPPIDVFYDGSTYWIGDGFHRVSAVKSVGLTEIDANVQDGGPEEALVFAAGANKLHGVRREAGDISKAIRVLLLMPKWYTPEAPKRGQQAEIARWVGVTQQAVYAVIEQMYPNRQKQDQGQSLGKVKPFTLPDSPPANPAVERAVQRYPELREIVTRPEKLVKIAEALDEEPPEQRDADRRELAKADWNGYEVAGRLLGLPPSPLPTKGEIESGNRYDSGRRVSEWLKEVALIAKAFTPSALDRMMKDWEWQLARYDVANIDEGMAGLVALRKAITDRTGEG